MKVFALFVFASILVLAHGYTCRSWPFARIDDALYRNEECDCCDCSDEPNNNDLTRNDCVVEAEAAAAARVMKERVMRKTKKMQRTDIGSIIKGATEKARNRRRAAEENKNQAEAEEAVLQARVRRERQNKFSSKADKIAEKMDDVALKQMLVQLSASHGEESGEWVADAVARAGVAHVDRTDAVAYAATLTRLKEALEREVAEDDRSQKLIAALGLDGASRESILKSWKSVLMHENGTLMIERLADAPADMPPHWNASEFPKLAKADEARAAFDDADADEKDHTKLEQALEHTKTPFNYGPNKSYVTLDGKCFNIPKPLRNEPGARIERPSEICLYRYARYKKFLSHIVDLRTGSDHLPTQFFVDKETIKSCKDDGGHKTLVSFTCFTEEALLFSEASSRCVVNVTIGTPLGC